MAIFYLLPSRPFLGQHFGAYLRTLFPGLDWGDAAWPQLADVLTTATQLQEGVYVVHREELPDSEDVPRALADGFGAEPGDEVVEVRAGIRPGEWIVQRSQLAA
jgi:hypothetical protein